MSNSKIRILHVIPNLKKGGAERIALDICNELAKRDGVEVRILIFTDGNDYEYLSKNIRIDVVPAKVVPSISGFDKIDLDEYQRYIANFQPHIIHSHLFEAEVVTRRITQQGIRYFTHTHSNTRELRNPDGFQPFSKHWLIAKYVYRMMQKRYKICNNSFITISNSTREYFTKNFPSFTDQIFYLPNAIDVASFYTEVIREPEKEGVIKMISVGNINANKNQSFQIEVAREFKKRGISFHLDIVGGGVLSEKIRAMVNSYELETDVSLLGMADDVRASLNRNHIFIHTAHKEAFGLVMLEAMAAGLPVVCLDGGGNRDLIRNEYNGYILKQADINDFVNKVLACVQSPEQYQKMCENARNTAKQYDIVNYVDKLLEIYNS